MIIVMMVILVMECKVMVVVVLVVCKVVMMISLTFMMTVLTVYLMETLEEYCWYFLLTTTQSLV